MPFLRLLCRFFTIASIGALLAQVGFLLLAYKLTGEAWFFPWYWFASTSAASVFGVAVELRCVSCKTTTS